MTIAPIHPGPAEFTRSGLRPPHPAPMLSQLAEGVAARPELWSAMAHHNQARRRPVRLAATETYEIWVIGWMPDQGLDLHDHGGSYGVLRVLEGNLVETVLARGRLRRQRLAPGQRRLLPVDTVHAVRGTGGPATSVHVYSPPLRAMTHYRADGERVGTEVMAPVRPALPSSLIPHLIHPAGR